MMYRWILSIDPRLRGFPSELLELPTQSTRCFLADIRPPDTTEGPMTEDGCWPVKTMEALIQLVAGKKLVAKTMVSVIQNVSFVVVRNVMLLGCLEWYSIALVYSNSTPLVTNTLTMMTWNTISVKPVGYLQTWSKIKLATTEKQIQVLVWAWLRVRQHANNCPAPFLFS